MRTLLVAGVYGLVVLAMWGPFALHSGMSYETGWVVTSETSPWAGFFFFGDATRPHLLTFFHISYLIGEVFAPGSWVPYQVVYAALWVARGWLVFLILRRLFPEATHLAYAAGALTLVHSSDHALQWVGQLHQFAFLFWMLLAWYFLLLALDAGSRRAAALLFCGAALFQHMSLWTYESGLFILLLMPATVLLVRKRRDRRARLLVGAWYVVPAVYCLATIHKFLYAGGRTYQSMVMRPDVTAGSVLSDLAFNVGSSVAFWRWQHDAVSSIPVWGATALAVLAAAAFLAGGAALAQAGRRSFRDAAMVMAMGAVWLPMSFPAYLLLDSSRTLWRTQMLSGPGTAMLLAGTVFLVAGLIRGGPLRRGLALAALGIVVSIGAACAIHRGDTHRRVWENHRRAVAGILRAVPQVAPGTVVLLTNAPKTDPPFVHNMWFEYALRLAYPHVPVTGGYWLDGGRPAPGDEVRLPEARRVIALRHEAGGAATRILETLPAEVCPKDGCPAGYAPHLRVTGTAPSPRAVRRYLRP
jgi:hypothetical protein